MQQFLTRHLLGWVLLLSLWSVGACKKKEDAAQGALIRAGYQMTADDYFKAIAKNDHVNVKRFIEGGMQSDIVNERKQHGMHVAAAVGGVETAEVLIQKPIDLDAKAERGYTPLMLATLANQHRMVAWLLGKKAKADIKDDQGYTALMLGVREGHAKCVGELAAYQREHLDTALLYAAMEGKVDVMDVLTNFGASVHAKMEDGRSALMLASENGHADAVRLLMDLGAGRYQKDDTGKTAAELAKDAGHTPLAAELQKEASIKEWALESSVDLAQQMEVQVTSSAAKQGKEIKGKGTAIPVTLEGQTVGKSELEGGSAADGSGAKAGLVMRQYRERYLPLELQTVEGETAVLRYLTGQKREIRVRPGDSVGHSRLVVQRVTRHLKTSKDHQGKLSEVSEVEVKDVVTGVTRKWITGVPIGAHDPVALVEDLATQRKYIASPGQKFRTQDGKEWVVSDVRSNQLVLEDQTSQQVHTLPLRGIE